MARRVVAAINRQMGEGTAQALDGRQIRVTAPEYPDARVAFMGRLENIEVAPVPSTPKVVMNARTGSVVMNQRVTLDACAVSHGNLSVVIGSDMAPDGSMQSTVRLSQDGSNVLNVKAGTNLAEVVKALNSLGANPQDLLAILQAMKAAGALRADLEII
jgi:flagellar P-ring protein precursor FlgI